MSLVSFSDNFGLNSLSAKRSFENLYGMIQRNVLVILFIFTIKLRIEQIFLSLSNTEKYK